MRLKLIDRAVYLKKNTVQNLAKVQRYLLVNPK